MDKIRKVIGYRTLKTAIGAAIAVFISQLLGLSYAANSGIIVILSVQSTKKKSRDLALQRLLATILALATGTVVFSILGFTALSFGVYLLIFIPIAVKFKFHDAIVPCSVLVTHILSVKSVAPNWLLNEFMQMVIGAGVGLLMNMHIPSVEGQLCEGIKLIEENMQKVLKDMAACLRKPLDAKQDGSLIADLGTAVGQGRETALLEASNHPDGKVTYFLRYMDMRNSQYELLKNMGKYVQRVRYGNAQSEMAAMLTDYVAAQVSEPNTKEAALTGLEEYRVIFRAMELPKTREEFENRASLYEYVNDLENLISVKRSFVEALTESEKQKFGKIIIKS
ncbi:MAG: aromatic acid exporter family protein [Youngiibacter sp.]|nr:aromatic acid exporter family protein [Youngiibacter sp.]